LSDFLSGRMDLREVFHCHSLVLMSFIKHVWDGIIPRIRVQADVWIGVLRLWWDCRLSYDSIVTQVVVIMGSRKFPARRTALNHGVCERMARQVTVVALQLRSQEGRTPVGRCGISSWRTLDLILRTGTRRRNTRFCVFSFTMSGIG
jgi:hypothetical protein